MVQFGAAMFRNGKSSPSNEYPTCRYLSPARITKKRLLPREIIKLAGGEIALVLIESENGNGALFTELN